jgi:hypothetical protein
MPAAPESQVLQHDDRIAGGELAQHVFEARRELVGNHAVTARGRHHLDLQAALALGEVHLRDEILGGHLDAEAGQHGGERGGAALVLVLREEGHLRELDPLGQPGRQTLAELRSLRPQARAAGEQAAKRALWALRPRSAIVSRPTR